MLTIEKILTLFYICLEEREFIHKKSRSGPKPEQSRKRRKENRMKYINKNENG